VAFASLDELQAYVQQQVDPVTGALLLDLATAEIQGYTGQTIEAVADETVRLVGNWSHQLELPERPVTAVTSVTMIDPQVSQVLVQNQDYTWQRRGLLWRPRGYSLATERTFDIGIYANWGGPDREVEVTYSHGYATPPVFVKKICLEMAKRVIVNPSGVMREAIDGYNTAYDRNIPPGVSLEQSEEKRLNRLRRTSYTARVQS